MVKDGDHILIGLSGGKDSLALVDFLGRRSKIFSPRFEVVVAHIVMRNIPYHSDLDYLRGCAEEHGLPFIVRETEFAPSTDRRKSPCFLCSWNRRKQLFTIAQEHGCNKIALGHHMDDIIETLYMNMMFQGAFSTMPPILRMRKFPLAVIRPLCLIPERLLADMAALRGFKPQDKSCPYEHSSHRAAIKGLLREMERLNPEMRHNIWGSMTNVQAEMLPPKVK